MSSLEEHHNTQNDYCAGDDGADKPGKSCCCAGFDIQCGGRELLCIDIRSNSLRTENTGDGKDNALVSVGGGEKV